MLTQFLLAFVPLFVALDVFGSFPLFLSITERYSASAQRHIAGQATLTAFVVGTAFLFVGEVTMRFLGITIHDFRVGGGIILLCFAVYDLLFSHLQRSKSEQIAADASSTGSIPDAHGLSMAIVPLGIPLIVGPAALTALLLLGAQVGSLMTLAAFALNILLVYLIFANAARVTRRVPQALLVAASKVVALFLAAIAVMMVRTGLAGMLAAH